jgi:S-formylglutathione hydrolase FrmB
LAVYPDYLNHGDKAEYYDAFINNELYSFAKKKATVRKFNSVAIAGCSLGGLSAFDIAWTHADKIDKVGVFSGSFKWSDKSTENPDYSDKTDRIMLNKIRSSRKKPGLKYWFYGDDENEKGMRYHDSITINHTKDLVELIKSKNVCLPGDIMYMEDTDSIHGYTSWSKAFPAFLIWAFGK